MFVEPVVFPPYGINDVIVFSRSIRFRYKAREKMDLKKNNLKSFECLE